LSVLTGATLNQLITTTASGFYCEAGDFYIDPWQPVPRAVVTHAHGDHTRRGCGAYLVSSEGETVFRVRLGDDAPIQTIPYGQKTSINGVSVSLHPAGHILGSAQVRVEHNGYVAVVSGDYKTEADRTCTPLEIVSCNHFVTEATFGLPIYHWQPQETVLAQINDWWRANAERGKSSIVYCYALGKAQRVLAGLDPSIGPILTHGATERLNEAYRAAGIDLPPTTYAINAKKSDAAGALVIAPLSARGSSWTSRFGPHASGFVSGWMRIRGARRQRAVDRGFILSDHADWEGLLATIAATGAERVGVTHGYVPVLTRWLQEQGIDAYGVQTRYTGERDDASDAEEAQMEPEA
jgi:putative mRNA 3-end processing factor